MSKTRNDVEIAAANAITTLNTAKISFSGMNLANIKIPGANLAQAMLDSVNFSGANLENVNFRHAWMRNVKFDNANLNSIILGETISIDLAEEIYEFSFSANGYNLVSGS